MQFNVEVKDGQFVATIGFKELADGVKTPADGFMNIATIRGFFLQATDECLGYYFDAVKKSQRIITPGGGKQGAPPFEVLH